MFQRPCERQKIRHAVPDLAGRVRGARRHVPGDRGRVLGWCVEQLDGWPVAHERSRGFLDGTALNGAEPAYREYALERGLWQFGFHPGHVAGFLAEYGWRELEQLGPDEYAERYLGPLGRPSPVSDIEVAVLAEKMREQPS